MDALEFVDEVRALYAAEDYVSALTVISTAEGEGKVTTELLLLKAACIQLCGNTDYPLARAFEIYQFLLQRKPNDARVLVEAGFYLLNVEDNAAAARTYFAKAVGSYTKLLEEAAKGLERSIEECKEGT